jgi:hypothetical protein
VLEHLRPIESAPDDFHPARATDEERIRHGLPPKPDPASHPKHHDKWERTMARPLRPIAPKFEPMHDRIHVPVEPHNSNGATTQTWSGAVVTDPPRGDRFVTASAAWIVPNVYPPASAWHGDGWVDGLYHCSAWVGLDGWCANELLQVGTAQECVVRGGRITSQRAYAWFEWWPAYEIAFSNFPVKPGDLVSCVVCAPRSSTRGFVSIGNLASGVTTSTGIDAPPGAKLQGVSAEWILEDPCYTDDEGTHPYAMPDFGATVFYDAIAGCKHHERDLDDAMLVNMVNGSTRVSTAVKERDVLLVYAGKHGP